MLRLLLLQFIGLLGNVYPLSIKICAENLTPKQSKKYRSEFYSKHGVVLYRFFGLLFLELNLFLENDSNKISLFFTLFTSLLSPGE